MIDNDAPSPGWPRTLCNAEIVLAKDDRVALMVDPERSLRLLAACVPTTRLSCNRKAEHGGKHACKYLGSAVLW